MRANKKADAGNVGRKGIVCMPKEHFKTQSNEKSRSNSCHHERHLSGLALKIYNLHWRLSKNSKDGIVTMTNQRLAKLVGARVSERSDHISRVKTSLVRDGWLESLGVSKGSKTGTWAGGRYRAVSHEDWVELKTEELQRSPCHPVPVVNQVSSVKPGGRAYQQKSTPEVHTVKRPEVHTDVPAKSSRRVGLEVHTPCVGGSTSTVCSGKYTHSVDSTTGGFQPRRVRQLTQGSFPLKPPNTLRLSLALKRGASPPLRLPPKKKFTRRGRSNRKNEKPKQSEGPRRIN